MKKILLICYIILFPQVALSESYTLEKIVIKSTQDAAEFSSLSNNYPLQILSAVEIRDKNLNSLPELLDYISGMDLRNRGSFGVQGDLSLNGSTYEQVGVLINGLRINDPQTGHHNLDIPLTPFDIERIEVIKEGTSSFYGQGAFAGSVNIITKKAKKRVSNMDFLFGEHALFGQAFSFNLPKDDLLARVSFDHKISKAARPNTDFEYNTASCYAQKSFDNTKLDALFGYQKKDFGADSFYSNLFPEEEEHTETLFIKTGLDSKFQAGFWKNSLFFRKHRDKFILQRNNPTSVNYHTTYVYGLNSQFNLPLKFADLLFGIDLGEDEINSTNLGKHSRVYESGSLGFIPNLKGKLTSDLRLRVDNYQKWGLQESYNFGLGYSIIEHWKIKSSFARAFRIPSFTELYYSDAANKGNPELKIEKTDNFRLGLEFFANGIEASLSGFLRQARNLIDWTRSSETNPWQATSLGRVDFSGLEFASKLKTDLNFKSLSLQNIAFSYNYTKADKKTSGFFSKYALDILKNQFILDLYSVMLGLNFNWQLSYNERDYGETYFVGNLYIGKKLRYKDFACEPFIKIDNFSNAKYSEVASVTQPGRWIKSGLKFEW